jgi:hypothetical protein
MPPPSARACAASRELGGLEPRVINEGERVCVSARVRAPCSLCHVYFFCPAAAESAFCFAQRERERERRPLPFCAALIFAPLFAAARDSCAVRVCALAACAHTHAHRLCVDGGGGVVSADAWKAAQKERALRALCLLRRAVRTDATHAHARAQHTVFRSAPLLLTVVSGE